MKRLFFVPILFLCCHLFAQYTVNGSASTNSCHCYTLTPNALTRSGSVWNNIKIDLTQSFDFNFDVYLGCNTDNGADGIVFVLQPISTSVGGSGGGLGFEGISPSVGVTIDTWQNGEVNDPGYDHIAIQLNGRIDHANATDNIAGPVTALSGNDNIEDCQWHTLRIKWDAPLKQLIAYVDGIMRESVTKDFVTDVFGGNPNVFWGFTGSTGGAANLQQFCTALSPLYKSLQGQTRCINSPLNFIDSTISFAPVTKMYWDFGDGSPVDSVNNNPVHTYTAAGDYTVLQTVVGADGCREVNTQPLRIGSKPLPGFKITDDCVLNPINFEDTSKVAIGTINGFYWDFDNGATSAMPPFATQYTTGGDKNIRLVVKTVEGCISDTFIKPIHIFQRPVLDFTFTDSVCLGTATNFSGTVINSPDPVLAWVWTLGDDNPRNTQNASIIFPTSGPRNVLFAATANGNAGCLGIVEKTVFIRSKPTAFFKNDFVCQSISAILVDSSFSADGSTVTNWHWDFGNGQTSSLQNPPVTFNTMDTNDIKLTVQAGGCVSDTFTKPVMVAAQPVADFGYAGTLCENMPVQFSDSSKVQNGSAVQWEWAYQNAQWSGEQNPSKAFAAGNQTVSLIVVSDKGCKSNTTSQSFTVIGKPLFDINFADACTESTVNFTARDASGNINKWQWDFGDNSTANIKDTTHTYTIAGRYPVVLSVEAGNGCTNADTSFIIIYSTNASAGNNTIIAAANEPVQLNASGGASYEWLPVDGLSNTSVANPIAINKEDREYHVRAYTPVGCDTYDTVLIKIYDGPDIYVPTAFNPLSKWGNHIFKVTAVGIRQFKYFNVYNRLGQLVFSTSNPSQGWDGIFKGQPQPAGAYVWMAAGTTFRGNEILRKGTVVLLR